MWDLTPESSDQARGPRVHLERSQCCHLSGKTPTAAAPSLALLICPDQTNFIASQSLAHSPRLASDVTHRMSSVEFILCPPPGDRVMALYSMSRRQTDFQYLLAVENEEFYHRGHKHE